MTCIDDVVTKEKIDVVVTRFRSENVEVCAFGLEHMGIVV